MQVLSKNILVFAFSFIFFSGCFSVKHINSDTCLVSTEQSYQFYVINNSVFLNIPRDIGGNLIYTYTFKTNSEKGAEYEIDFQNRNFIKSFNYEGTGDSLVLKFYDMFTGDYFPISSIKLGEQDYFTNKLGVFHLERNSFKNRELLLSFNYMGVFATTLQIEDNTENIDLYCYSNYEAPSSLYYKLTISKKGIYFADDKLIKVRSGQCLLKNTLNK